MAKIQSEMCIYIIDVSICHKVMKFYTFVPVHTYMYVCENIKPKCLKHMAECDFPTGTADCNKLKHVITSSAVLPEKA